MRTCDKGSACHVLQGKASQLTLISVADPEPLKRVMEDLRASGIQAATERHNRRSPASLADNTPCMRGYFPRLEQSLCFR